MAIKMGEGGVTWKHLSECDLSIKFYPMIPRDREQEVNEAVLLMQANSLSPKTALDLLDKVADPNEEYENIREHLEWMAELSAAGSAASQQDIQPSAQTQVQAPIATSGQDNL
jgi:UDP-N-acetylglucosamine:LPS N-acetylglucosamine transferase